MTGNTPVQKQERILSVYFCAGCPTKDGTANVLRSLQDAGVDMIEIGIPFSDPMADGPVIQGAATRALQGGMSLRLLFSQLRDIRRTVHIPLLLMGYLNPILNYGFEAFCRDCRACGIDGLIIPDLPLAEYVADYRDTALRYGLHVVMLITPETSDDRVREIDRQTGGFIYMVSSAAVTGAQRSFLGADASPPGGLRRVQPRDVRRRVQCLLRRHRRQPLRHALGRVRGRCHTGHREAEGDDRDKMRNGTQITQIGHDDHRYSSLK